MAKTANSYATLLLLASTLSLGGCTPYAQSYQPAVDQQMSPVALNSGRSYPTDLSACREVVASSSTGKNSTEAKGAGVGALGGAGVGLLAGEPIGGTVLSAAVGAGVGAIAGRAWSDAEIRGAINQCLQLRGWTVLGAE